MCVLLFVAVAVVLVVVVIVVMYFLYRLYTGGRGGTSPFCHSAPLLKGCDRNSAKSDIEFIRSKRGTVPNIYA